MRTDSMRNLSSLSLIGLLLIGTAQAQNPPPQLQLETLISPTNQPSQHPDWQPRVPSIDYTNTPSDINEKTNGVPYITSPPPLNLLSETDSTLSKREASNVATARRFIDGIQELTDLASPGDKGAIVFRFGATLPTIVCAPLYICDVALQTGETVNNVQVGDPVRWKITPATSGDGTSLITHVVVKPSDIGLSTNLLVTTDRRTYLMKLVSRKDDWMPSIAFSYPEDEAAQWTALALQRQQEKAATVIPETGQQLSLLDFGYRLRGDSPTWQPLRVYNDGSKTYIQFPRAMQADESPALVAIGTDKKEQMVNYRPYGDLYIVDKVLDQALLVSGVGRHQVKVKIEHHREN